MVYILLKYNSTGRDCRAGPNVFESSNPTRISDFYGRTEKSKTGIIPIVISSTEIAALAYAYARSYDDSAVIIYPHKLAQPDIITDLKEPRALDRHSGFADESFTNSCAKRSQYSSL